MILKFKISGIKCRSCVDKISKALNQEDFKNVSITLSPPEGFIESEQDISISKIQAILSSVGDYTIEVINTDATATTQKTHPAKKDTDQNDLQSDPEENLTPLGIIILYIICAVFIRAYISNDYTTHSLMVNFMGGFFVLFSLFKMINLKGFAEAYSTYDIIAKRSQAYSYSYPFIELFLGISYFLGTFPILTNAITAILMFIGAIGVYLELRKKRHIQCACLGTSLKLPMTKVTLAEDLLMGVMAILMLTGTI